jgi:hypothetical protein
LPISQGDFIDVKERLNTGEYHELMARMSPVMTPGERSQLDTRAVMTSKVLEYLIGWSFVDDGTPVPYSPEMREVDRLAIINSLDDESFNEIRDAIEAHEEAQDKARAAAKNGQGGESESSAISSSPNILAGATTT